jgi:hypothetical protein
MSINLVDGFTLTISDPDNLLGSNQAALITDMNYVVTLLSTYIVFQKPLDLQINFAPASQNPNNTDGLLPSAPAWVNYQGQETLAAMVKGQTGVDPNDSTSDAGFTFYAGNDGTLKNFGSPFWFDPNPILGQNPSIPAGDTDFIGVATHELFHCLGFASWPAVNAPWNQHTVEVNGVWYYSSPAVNNLLGGMLPLAPNTDGTAADHIGDTSLSYQPIKSDLMYQFGNYASNRLDIGLLDLTILHDLGWTIQDYDSLPLVDTLDATDITGTAGNDTVTASRNSSEILTGNGNDTIILPSAAGNGDYDIDGGTGFNVVVIDRQSSNFNIVAYDNHYLLQSVTGSDGVSILKNVEVLHFIDKSIAIQTRTADDFSGGGMSNLLWTNGTTFTEWQSTGSGFNPNVDVGSVGGGWTLAGTGDFTGAGQAGLLWFNNGTDQFTIWDSNGNGFTSNSYVNSVAPGWTPIANADFNGDGASDLIWQNGTTFTEWRASGNGFTPNVFVGSVASGWNLAATGDFLGNGDADLVWFNSGTFTVWDSTGNGFTANNFVGSVAPGWTLAGVGDFTGNGRNDLLWLNGGSGQFTIWNSNGSGFTPNSFVGSVASGWTLAGTGDYNGDGRSDLLWRNTTTGTFTEWQSTGNGFTPNVYVNGTVPTSWTLQSSPTHLHT